MMKRKVSFPNTVFRYFCRVYRKQKGSTKTKYKTFREEVHNTWMSLSESEKQLFHNKYNELKVEYYSEHLNEAELYMKRKNGQKRKHDEISSCMELANAKQDAVLSEPAPPPKKHDETFSTEPANTEDSRVLIGEATQNEQPEPVPPCPVDGSVTSDNVPCDEITNTKHDEIFSTEPANTDHGRVLIGEATQNVHLRVHVDNVPNDEITDTKHDETFSSDPANTEDSTVLIGEATQNEQPEPVPPCPVDESVTSDNVPLDEITNTNASFNEAYTELPATNTMEVLSEPAPPPKKHDETFSSDPANTEDSRVLIGEATQNEQPEPVPPCPVDESVTSDNVPLDEITNTNASFNEAYTELPATNTMEVLSEPAPPPKSANELYFLINSNANCGNPIEQRLWRDVSKLERKRYARAVAVIKREYIAKYTKYLESLSPKELFDYYNKNKFS